MFKWIRGFISGVLLITGINAIGLMGVYIWILKDVREPKNKRNYFYHRY